MLSAYLELCIHMFLLLCQPMPEFKRIEGCVLDGEAFADCLMSLEFLHNFAAALGFGKVFLKNILNSAKLKELLA